MLILKDIYVTEITPKLKYWLYNTAGEQKLCLLQG